MQKIFDEVQSLDKKACEKFFLSEDILMEHAASSIFRYIKKRFKIKTSVLILCGCGNNGADGLALGRLLHKLYDVKINLVNNPKSQMAILQEKRAKSLNIEFVDSIFEADIIVDCIFGTGLNKKIDKKIIDLVDKVNSFKSFKIACDIPSGIEKDGKIKQIAFKADTTITMGAFKTALFSDIAKDFVGKLKVANLGLPKEDYEDEANIFLLEKSDMELPFRNKKNSHKGSFGHVNVILGEKKGAAIIASNAAFYFGAGLVSLITKEKAKILNNIPNHIMSSEKVSKNCTAIAIGMGLGEYKKEELKTILDIKAKKVIDADLFYNEIILAYLDERVVLTPHPKEFISLLKLTKIADITIEELQENRFLYVKQFCQKYKEVVLLLKGTNVLISKDEKIFVNTYGSSILSKGGSGDVLSGLIASLLAQGYETLDAAITASLAHTLAANNYKKNNYSFGPQDLIEEIKKI